MKRFIIAFVLAVLLVSPLPLQAETPKKEAERVQQVENEKQKEEVRNLSGEQGFPDTCKIPVSLYLAIFMLSLGVVIYVK